MSALSPGARVSHPAHGDGTVNGLRRGGRVLVVGFDGEPLSREVPAREIALLSPASPPPATTRNATAATPAKKTTKNAKNAKKNAKDAKSGATQAAAPPPKASALPPADADADAAARTLEAMRLGVVPAVHLDAYTVGRDGELATVAADLTAARDHGGAVRAFLGDYGTGKTHLLELIAARARAANFLTAHVVLDPTETAPSHPKRVYRALVRGLRYPDLAETDDHGLAPLLDRALATPAALDAVGLGLGLGAVDDGEAHLYLAAALAYWRTLSDPATADRVGDPGDLDAARRELLDWLEGHPTVNTADLNASLSRLPGAHPRLYSLKDFRPWARIYGYLLSGVATLARAAGYAGLCVLLDEAEFYALLTGDDRFYARTLFKALTFAALGDGALEAGELPFDADELDIGGQGILQRLPARYGDAPGLYVAFAMTPAADGLAAIEGAIPKSRIAPLAPLNDADYQELCRRVAAFYVRAAPDTGVTPAHVDAFGQIVAALVRMGVIDSPRPAMKFLLELLDLMRHRPERMGDVIRQVRGTFLF